MGNKLLKMCSYIDIITLADSRKRLEKVYMHQNAFLWKSKSDLTISRKYAMYFKK